MSQPAGTQRTERFETVIIGAGQAGLSTGYYLAKGDADFVILDRAAQPGQSWRNRWDSLRLFTPAKRNGLPGMPFSAPPNHLPDKDEVAHYMTRYAEHFDLPVRGNSTVDRLAHDGTRFQLTVGSSHIEADQVVVATGPFAKPVIPAVTERLSPDIHQLASTQYRNPFELPEGPVLVVGAGNSGAQIALELSRDRKVWLAGRETGYVPRRFLGRDIFDFIWPPASRLLLGSALGRRVRRKLTGGDGLIGMTRDQLQQAGIERVGRLEREQDGLPVCGDQLLQPRTIIWCTGLRPDHDWIQLPGFADNGMPIHVDGSSTVVPGLHFVGLRFQRRITSSLVGGVGADAAVVAAAVMARSEQE